MHVYIKQCFWINEIRKKLSEMYERRLSVIIPVYNEERQIYRNLLKMEEMISTFCNNFEMIAVNDGSVDHTEDEISKAVRECPRIKAAGYRENRGKGGAIKHGIKYAKGKYIAFLDADFDLSPMHLKDFMQKIEETDAAAVIGSKLHKDSKVDYPFARRVMSFVYYIMLKILFHLDVKDTQTGVKLFQAGELLDVIMDVRTAGFAYDIEILTLIRQNGGKIVEMPVELVFQRKNGWGRIRLIDVICVIRDTIYVYLNIKKIKHVGVKLENAKER